MTANMETPVSYFSWLDQRSGGPPFGRLLLKSYLYIYIYNFYETFIGLTNYISKALFYDD